VRGTRAEGGWIIWTLQVFPTETIAAGFISLSCRDTNMYLAVSALSFRPVSLLTSKSGSVLRFMTSVSYPIISTSRPEAEVSHSIQIHPNFLGRS
jgi:hypothetical protein